MPSVYELELALEQQAQERERALWHTALLRAASAAQPGRAVGRRAAAGVAALMARLAPPRSVSTTNAGDVGPRTLAHLAPPPAAATDDQCAA